MLNRHVLVLNQNYEPLSICTAKRAIVMVFLGKAEIVEKDVVDIHSVSRSFPLPSVVRLSMYIAIPRKKILLTRKNILKRDSYRCQYCGTKHQPLTLDHVIPKNRGGEDTWENLVCACAQCNNKKGQRTPEEAGMVLTRFPRRPSYLMFIRYFIGISDQRWRRYLFLE
jgi:5-methylcytosine-specific restriction endonuclease McrA